METKKRWEKNENEVEKNRKKSNLNQEREQETSGIIIKNCWNVLLHFLSEVFVQYFSFRIQEKR